MKKFIKTSISDFLNENEKYKVVSRVEFKDALLDIATLDLEDNQVKFPKISGRKQNLLFSGNMYNLYVLDKKNITTRTSGPFELTIEDNDNKVIGFVRGTHSKGIISFNLIYIKEEYRGSGIGTDIYEKFLEAGHIIKSDTEITDSTFSLYDNLTISGYKPLIFDDKRVGLKK
jgi:hypothetical protein